MINLSKSFDQQDFIKFLGSFFPDFAVDERQVPKQSEVFPAITYIGASEALRTSVLVIHTTLGINSRISLTKASFKLLKNFGIYRALVVYLNPDQTIWRLSLLTAQPVFSEGRVIEQLSNPQRHSFVLGSDVGVATARKFLVNMGSVKNFEDLQLRFSIEAINKEFYSEIANYFYDLIGRYDQAGKLTSKPLLELPGDATHRDYQEYAIRLFGRIIFCWFLKEKKDNGGSQLLPSALFDHAVREREDILPNVLEPLFFGCLNTPLAERKPEHQAVGFELVPYLNGGLFYPHDGIGGDYYSDLFVTKAKVPDIWFRELFETLSTYNFTLDENLNFDVELSIDPEMLGRIFENLLAEINPESGESARRTTGSFYTPRKIVNHMTDMSLREFLREKTDVDDAKLDALITIDTLDDRTFLLTDSEKNAIATSLYGLKSLDPACGSGAYPIGLLQKLLFILEQVDPEFILGRSMLPMDFLKIKPHLANNRNYLRKFVLIRDVIHGVDIQPVAIEISKLRCFLTLIVEQDVVDNLPNRGLESLPNLDFQFVCANSLIPLKDKQKNPVLWGDDESIEVELDEIRREYYSITSQAKKEKLKKRYQSVVTQELSLFGESTRTSQLKTFQPFTPNSQASFFDAKAMFGLDSFDLVIGNPPYVKIEHLSSEVIKQLGANYSEVRLGKVKSWADDLYVHFIFRSFELVGDGGIVCLITNDSFIGLDTKARVRFKLLDENLVELIGCPVETFGATIYTAIFLATKSKTQTQSYIGSKFLFPGFDLSPLQHISKEFVRKLPNQRLVLEENQLVAKLLQNSPLSEFIRVIDTGMHSGNVRDKLFFSEPSATITKKLLQGRQIQKWSIWWDSPAAKYKYCDPTYVPQDTFGIGRGGKPSNAKEYWTYCRGGDEKYHYVPERLLLRQTSDSLLAAFQNREDDGQFYTDNTLFTLIPIDHAPLKYFLGLINSRLLNYVYQFLSSEEGKVLAQVKTGLVEQLPVVFDKDRADPLIALVDEIIETKRSDPLSDVSALENDIDELVCLIYGLDQEEKELFLFRTSLTTSKEL